MKRNNKTTFKNNYRPLFEEFEDLSKAEIQSYREETENKLSRRETVKCLLQLKTMYPKCALLVNAIIGNTRYLDKIVFVTDGSWRMNRIWIPHDNDIYVEVAKKGDEDRDDGECASATKNPKAAKNAYKEICNNYEKIFIQCSFKDILDSNRKIQEMIYKYKNRLTSK